MSFTIALLGCILIVPVIAVVGYAVWLLVGILFALVAPFLGFTIGR
jgi:hypothetical protein